MDRDRILLTPGPLTTTLRTKLAMLRDWGSWDADFNAVTAGVCSRLLDIARYFFVNAMTTISAVVFLFSPQTKVASIAILNPDEAGEIGAAAACAVMIVAASATATTLFWLASRVIERRTQAWKA